MNLIIKNLSKSSSLTLGLLVVLLSFFSSTCVAKYLSLENENLTCLQNDCSLILQNKQILKINKNDERIIDLIEENNGKEKLINYLFYTTDINELGTSYSGKPLELLISLNANGVIIDNLKLIKHSEPILLTGIPIEKLLEAICFYKGKNINNRIKIGDDSTGEVSIPIIAGATVTSLMLHETILDTARDVSVKLGKMKEDALSQGGLTNEFKKFTWTQLNKLGAIKNYKLNSDLKETISKNDSILIDVYFADLRHPSIGKNLLGCTAYENLFNDLKNNESAIIILNNGEWSFKGSGFVRGGIYDRFRIEQGNNVFTFKDSNFQNVYDLEIDIEDFREAGIFILNNTKFKAWKEWNLGLLHDYHTYYVKYDMPKEFCIKQKSIIIDIWLSKIKYISMFMTIWILVIIIFIKRDTLSKNSFYLSIIYNFILMLDIYIIGLIFQGQPSVVNILTLINNPKTLEVFKLDPCIYLGWIMIMSTIFIWGKSLFCGWICPFGALQELLFKVRSLLIKNDTSIEFKNIITDKLIYLRYIIFLSLMLISFIDFHLAEKLAEVEPFKTTWNLGIINRPILFSMYTISLLAIGLLTYRFFCRFICPLGAFLSILSLFTFFKINRRGTCSVCKICKQTCNSRAITDKGNVDSTECFGCFTCINNMYNYDLCPPYKKLKIREKYEPNWREI